jgi:nitrogen fixation protein FixH
MSQAQTARPFTGRHMLFIMLAFFATVFTANMTMVYFASHSWTGLVVKNSYVASQEFNATTEKMLANAAVDAHPVLSFEGGVLRLALKTKTGEAVAASNVKLSLGRPSNESQDTSFDLVTVGAGLFESTQSFGPGQWEGMITADVPGHGNWSRPVALFVKD